MKAVSNLLIEVILPKPKPAEYQWPEKFGTHPGDRIQDFGLVMQEYNRPSYTAHTDFGILLSI